MYTVPAARAWWPAVGAPLERGVRPQPWAVSWRGIACDATERKDCTLGFAALKAQALANNGILFGVGISVFMG